MKILGFLPIIAISLAIPVFLPGSAQESQPQEQKITPPAETLPQEVQRPKLDYMSSFLSRTTGPLGLKEDAELHLLLRQSKFNWAIRAGVRHILN